MATRPSLGQGKTVPVITPPPLPPAPAPAPLGRLAIIGATLGGPILKENTVAEYYGTIYSFAESPVKKVVTFNGIIISVIR